MIKRIADAYANPPDGFTVHPRLKPQIDRRVAMASGGNVDWATAELYAFGSLVLEGRAVRCPGQDSRRGTFTQRHAVLIDRDDRRRVHAAARAVRRPGAVLGLRLAAVSEFAAMGFEYGYSVVRDDALVCWEAQFGDFADGAQTIIDEFISSGEAKWGQRSAVTLLLPHGYEGQGPDHSSGRPERFLQLAAENNMTVAMCSSPANYFHLLRRQGLSPVRRPLIAFTPKSLLRLKAAVSELDEFTDGTFQPVLARLGCRARACAACCCAAARSTTTWPPTGRENERADVAIVRVEQLYPLPADEIRAELDRYPERRARLGAGGAGQPGRVAVHGAQPARAPRRPAAAAGVARRPRPRRRSARTRPRGPAARSSPPPSPESHADRSGGHGHSA